MKALGLAVANVLVIAFAIQVDMGQPVMPAIALFSMLPALFVGGVLGLVAESTAAHRPVWRLSVLALPACGLVALLALAFDMLRYVPHACIPTLVAASMLERSTRLGVGLGDGGPPCARTSRTRSA